MYSVPNTGSGFSLGIVLSQAIIYITILSIGHIASSALGPVSKKSQLNDVYSVIIN